jgi:hypothetical protein
MKRLFLPFILMLGVFFMLPVQADPPQDAVTAAYLDSHPASVIDCNGQLTPAEPAFDALQGTRFESAEYHAGLCQATLEIESQLVRDQAVRIKAGYRRGHVDEHWLTDYAVTGELLRQYRRDLAAHCGQST